MFHGARYDVLDFYASEEKDSTFRQREKMTIPRRMGEKESLARSRSSIRGGGAGQGFEKSACVDGAAISTRRCLFGGGGT